MLHQIDEEKKVTERLNAKIRNLEWKSQIAELAEKDKM